MPVKVIGADRVATEFNRLVGAVDRTQEQVIGVIATQTISLLKQNTPRDTGELSRSWYEISRTRTQTTIGVTADQNDKLKYVIFGTRYIQPNDFVSPILEVVGDNIENIMRSYLKTTHPYLNNIQTGGIRGGVDTPSNIVGLTGTKFMKRRARGRSTIRVPRSGMKRFNRRIGLRRKA